MTVPRPALLLVPLLSLLARVPRTQAEWWRHEGTHQDPLGVFVAGLDDVDGDGVPDVLAGEQAYLSDCEAVVLSGADGQVLQAVNDLSVGSLAAAGDLDGDGRGDFLLGDFFNGEVRAYSGGTGALLYRIPSTADVNYGYSVAGVGDLDGDGFDDFAFSGVRGLYQNDVSVRSGRDGSVLYLFRGFKNFPIGLVVAGAGDVTGDGVPDLLVAGQDPVLVFSGANGKLVLAVYGAAPGGFGTAAVGAGDLDGDGRGDFLVSDPLDDTNGADAGAVFVIAGADGAVLWTLHGAAPGDRFGESLSGGRDVTGDGVPDFLVGTSWSASAGPRRGSVTVVSGAGAVPVYVFHGAADFQRLGSSVGLCGDLDGDGLDDLVLGSPGATNPLGQGRVATHRGGRWFLSVEPPVAAEQDAVTLHCGQGAPGRSASLFVVGVGGTPLFLRLLRQPLAGDGTLRLQGVVPAGSSGLQLDFLALTTDAAGRLLASTVESLTVQ